MITMSPAKIEEIISRHRQPDLWRDREPFYKGLFWTGSGGVDAGTRDTRYTRESTGRPNLLPLTLKKNVRRAEFRAACEGHEAQAAQIGKLEQALDGAGFAFHEEISLFARNSNWDTVSPESVHLHMLECAAPPRPEVMEEIADVSARLALAALAGVRGVVLRTEWLSGHGDHFSLHADEQGDGYRLEARQALDPDGKGRRYLDTPETPSAYGSRLARLADPLHIAAYRWYDHSSDKSESVACLVADMAAHGETSAIMVDLDGIERVITDLTLSLSIEEIAARIRGIVPNCHRIEAVRVLPPPRIRHRFYVVGGRIAADSPAADCDEGHLSLVEYAAQDGPARTSFTTRPSRGEEAALRTYCEKHLDRICLYRPNWIVDVDLASTGPCLARIGEIMDGRWCGDVSDAVLDALANRQRTAFSETELEMTGGSSVRQLAGLVASSAPPQDRDLREPPELPE